MNRPSAITVATIAAVLFAGSASMMVYNYLKSQAGKTFQGMAIATAATDIPIGTKLNGQQLRLTTWPKDSLPAGYCADTKALMGRVAVRPLNRGDVVTEQKLMPQSGANGTSIMTYIVPQGHRAVTVAVNEVAGVAGFITPNSRVDVVLTTPQPGAADKEDNISKIILQNVPVLASGQITEQKDGKPAVLPTVTLDLTPDDAEKLIVGAKKGSLQLLLRNVIDVASVDTKGATISKALGAGEPRVAAIRVTRPKKRVQLHAKVATPPPATFTVEIIKGGAKSRREFAQE